MKFLQYLGLLLFLIPSGLLSQVETLVEVRGTVEDTIQVGTYNIKYIVAGTPNSSVVTLDRTIVTSTSADSIGTCGFMKFTDQATGGLIKANADHITRVAENIYGTATVVVDTKSWTASEAYPLPYAECAGGGSGSPSTPSVPQEKWEGVSGVDSLYFWENSNYVSRNEYYDSLDIAAGNQLDTFFYNSYESSLLFGVDRAYDSLYHTNFSFPDEKFYVEGYSPEAGQVRALSAGFLGGALVERVGFGEAASLSSNGRLGKWPFNFGANITQMFYDPASVGQSNNSYFSRNYLGEVISLDQNFWDAGTRISTYHQIGTSGLTHWRGDTDPATGFLLGDPEFKMELSNTTPGAPGSSLTLFTDNGILLQNVAGITWQDSSVTTVAKVTEMIGEQVGTSTAFIEVTTVVPDLTSGKQVYFIRNLVANITITLPDQSAFLGKELLFVRNDNTGFTVTIETPDASTISGNATTSLLNYESAEIITDGTDYFLK